MRITLYQKQENNENVHIRYNSVTGYVSTNSWYTKNNVEYAKKYRQEHAEQITKYQKHYYQISKERIAKYQKQYYQEHTKQIAKCHKYYNKKYYQTENGKITEKRAKAKRKRSLGFTPLMSNPFPEEIQVDYHHINNIFVIPVPRQVHKSVGGKQHRIRINDWIEEHIGLVGV